ncbi:AAA family ATPase [Alkaliphilus peptidifermentans]|uniref:MoxR-like ATPase n=1 Tax=Alkaliphilus peptidifermentans DSM 18978 TaxID=1120976 RepID=A0A1G5AMD2_9FIRM|nr:MoxR family ATPase [Alkaliphilus peptidifermentans]SCX79012.1 MoxR-like ATPase [Alkaliphilus peptidifermentans DSM 18978]
MSTREQAVKILENMKRVIIGKDDVLEKVLICLLARGHLLIEDVPGVGKTTMVKTLAKSVNLSYSRMQFTPDMMPSDITGITLYNKTEERFMFKKGPIFNQIILADEINRTSPKTQASLLQAMEEGEVSIDEETYQLKKPFMVLATQNPIEYQGTFPLPEAQLDRFLMRVSLGYPGVIEEKEIIVNYKESKSLNKISAVASEEDIVRMQDEVDEVHVHEDILHYIVGISNASRSHSDIHLGASPRVSIDLYRGARALAFVRGRDYVIPDDVKEIVPYVLGHRLILSAEARIEGRRVEDIIKDVLKRVHVPVVSAIEG